MVSYNDSSAQTTEAWRSIDSTLRLDLFTLKNSLQGDTHAHPHTHIINTPFFCKYLYIYIPSLCDHILNTTSIL